MYACTVPAQAACPCCSASRVGDRTELVRSSWEGGRCLPMLLRQPDRVDDALAGAARAVVPGGLLVIQTLHPLTACGDRPYIDGWRSASGACLGSGFQDDAPWYFRTLGRWLELVNSGDWRLAAVEEPLDDNHYLPASLILIATRRLDDDPEL